MGSILKSVVVCVKLLLYEKCELLCVCVCVCVSVPCGMRPCTLTDLANGCETWRSICRSTCLLT